MIDPNHSHDHTHGHHSHGAGTRLEPQAQAILERGLGQLLQLSNDLQFQSLASQKYPLPLDRTARQ